MQEIKLSIPDGCKTVIINLDGENITTEFEPREEWTPQDGDFLADSDGATVIYAATNESGSIISYAGYWGATTISPRRNAEAGEKRKTSAPPPKERRKPSLTSSMNRATAGTLRRKSWSHSRGGGRKWMKNTSTSTQCLESIPTTKVCIRLTSSATNAATTSRPMKPPSV